ncbi:MAG: SDR family oxidoreductase [Thermoplasmatota archaeon]
MDGRVVLVTGANSGIGRETARALARLGARVVMACRSVERGEEARAELLRENPAALLQVEKLDLASLREVRDFAREFALGEGRLDVLVNNAGFHTAHWTPTRDGYESTFAVNHLAHFLLTRELLPLLEQSAPSRVVTVASDAHRGGRIAFDDLMGSERWNGLQAYAQSKLANVMFAYALARRLDGTNVTSNAVHPGSVRTGWGRGSRSGVFGLGVALASPFLLSAEKGALTSIWAASAPELAGVSGKYLVKRAVGESTRASRDVDAQERLWAESERLVERALSQRV